jgi:hypothetical protein
MKKAFLLIVVGIALSSIITCSTSRRYIEIQGSDAVFEYGKVKYEVWPGDKLEIVAAQTCRGGKGLCWRVRNIKTGETGYVSADKMKENHHVYTEEIKK